jgi:catalase
MGVSGFFDSNGNGVRLSQAVVFHPGRMQVIGRFSLGGGQPDVSDKPDAVRGLALQFSLPNGELWRTAMINFPVFAFRTPEAFYEQLIASKPDPNTGKPDPAKMEQFLTRCVSGNRLQPSRDCRLVWLWPTVYADFML